MKINTLGTVAMRIMPDRVKSALRKVIQKKPVLKKLIVVAAGEKIAPMNSDFVSLVKKFFDDEWYLVRYPDVAEARIDPLVHWLRCGWLERRFISPDATVLLGDEARKVRGQDWEVAEWQDQAIAIKNIKQSPKIIEQILKQGRHDFAVFAPGYKSLGKIKQIDSTDLMTRDGINIEAAYAPLTKRYDLIVCTPSICIGGAEKYISDLINVARTNLNWRVLMVVTEQSNENAQKLGALSEMDKIDRLFWQDICLLQNNTMLFARFLHSLRASTIVVNNSRIGLDAVSVYGRGLAANSRIFCTYFSFGINGLGAPFGARHPMKTMRFSESLTDNQLACDTLNRMWASSDYACTHLPARLDIANEATKAQRLSLIKDTHLMKDRPRRWIWVSRIELFKGTAILSDLAKKRPNDQFDIYGPLQQSLAELSLIRSNIKYLGVIQDIANFDFSPYDGFVFTSLFEGMPNIVLEMSQHLIPMVVSNVGGLSGTFNHESVLFCNIEEEQQDTVNNFDVALSKLTSFTLEEKVCLVENAFSQAVMKHAPEVYTADAIDILIGGKSV